MGNLPPLETDVILNDQTSRGMDILARSTEIFGRGLKNIDTTLASVERSMARVKQTGGGATGMFGGVQELTDTVVALEDTSERADQLRANLEALGEPDLGGLTESFAQFRSKLDEAKRSNDEFRTDIERTAHAERGLAGALSMLDDSPLTRSLPGAQELAVLGDMARLLPTINTGVLVAAGSIGLLVGGTVAAVAGFDAMARSAVVLEQSQNTRNKLVPIFDTPARQAIDDFQDAVQNRLSEKESLSILLQVDTKSALSDIENLRDVTETARKFADAYGLNLAETVGSVVGAINNLDEKQLQQIGIVKDVTAAYQDYAAAHQKLPQQLTDTEKQEALIGATLAQNADIIGKGESDAQKVVTSTDRIKAGWQDAKTSFTEWAGVMMSDEYTGIAGWWADRLEGLAGAIEGLNVSLQARTVDLQMAAQIPDDEKAKLSAIQSRVAFLNAAMDSNNAQMSILASEGQTATINQLKQQNEGFQRELEGYQVAIDKAREDFQRNLEVNLPDPNATVPQALIDQATRVQDPSPQDIAEGIQDRNQMQSEITRMQAEQTKIQQELERTILGTQGQIDMAYVDQLKLQLDVYDKRIAAYQEALAIMQRNPATAQVSEPPVLLPRPNAPEAAGGFPTTPAGTGSTAPTQLIKDVDDQQIDTQRIKLETQQVLATRYTTAINDARRTVMETNAQLAQSEAALADVISRQSVASSQMTQDLHTQRAAAATELTEVSRAATEGRAILQQQQLLTQQSQLGPQISQAQQQGAVIKTFIDTLNEYARYQGDLSRIILDGSQAVTSASQQAGESIASEGITLNARAIDATMKVMEAYDALSQNGISLAGRTAEDQLNSAWRMFEESQTKIAAYRNELEGVQSQLDEVNQQIDGLNNTPIDKMIAAGITDPAILESVVDKLEGRKRELEGQVSELERQISAVKPVDPAEMQATQQLYVRAKASDMAADAQLGLLLAERDYIASYQALRSAAASGNEALFAQSAAHAAAAEKAYLLALNQAKATSATTDLQVAVGEVPASLDYVIQQLERLKTTGDTQLQGWADDSIRSLVQVRDTFSNTTIPNPQIGEGGKGLNAPIAPDMQAQAENFQTVTINAANAGKQAYSLFLPVIAATTAAVSENVQAMLDHSNAMNESLGATQQLTGAQAMLAHSNAMNTALAEQTTRQYQLFLPVVQNSATAMQDSAIARLTDAAAAGRQYEAMYQTQIVAGLLIDSISGLPIAFDRAGLSSNLLESNLRNLVAQMNDLEFAAESAGISVASRLIPILGIGGALRQGTEWAGQAQAVRGAFETRNAELLAQGQSPLSPQVLQFGMQALQQSWEAQATDMTAAFNDVGSAAGGMADKMENAVKRMDDALDGLISGVLKDSTKGLIPLDTLLPRADEVDEDARRMADVAVKGFQSPWFEGLKGLFSEDELAGGEGIIKRRAAEMVRDHQEGLTTIFYNTDLAAQNVLKKIEAKKNTEALIAEVRDKVKAQAAASDIDIMDALGIDTSEERAAAAGRQQATAMALSFQDVIDSMLHAGAPGVTEPTAAGATATPDGKKGEETITPEQEAAVKTTVDVMGEAMVDQAADGNYMQRTIGAMLAKIKDKEDDIKAGGKTLAEWLGGSMLTNFAKEVPPGLLDILVTNLVPLMSGAMADQKERESGGTSSGTGGGPQ